MTYFGFLLRFLVIPIFVLLWLVLRNDRSDSSIPGFRTGKALWKAIGVHVLLAVVYTTPWDNYLVATRVWYYNPQLVTGIVFGYVPIEEYTFFVLETILSGLWWWFLARRLPLRAEQSSFKPNKPLIVVAALTLIAIWIVATVLLFFGNPSWTYLSIILFWALPAILPQLLFGADILWHYRRLVGLAILVPGTYLSLMDIVALRDTTWSISPTQTTGVLFFGILPLEEALFFLITNVLIIFGMTLLLAQVSEVRFAAIRNQVRVWLKRPVPPSSSQDRESNAARGNV